MAYETFREAVPVAREITLALGQLMIDGDEACLDGRPDERIEEIEHEPRSGFWPWTSGGFQIVLPASLAHHWGSGNAPAALLPAIDSGNAIIAEEWARCHPDRPGLIDCIHAEEGQPGHEFQSEAEEFESEAWASDTDCYFWKARVMFEGVGDMNGGETPRVSIDAYLNTDLNYGRDHIPWLRCYGTNPDRTFGEFKATIPLDKFVQLQPSHIAAIVKGATRRI